MKANAFFLGLASLTTGLLLATAAAASTLLTLTDEPEQSEVYYALPFVATAATMTISISGYQPLSYEYATDNSVTLQGSQQNLLGGYWDFTPAASGTFAASFNDGSAVPGLFFAGLAEGYYDTFSQAVRTRLGATYVLSFLYSNNPSGEPAANTPNGFLVVQIGGGVPATQSGYTGSAPTAGAPEPSAWALMLLGFTVLALAAQRRKHTKTGAPSLS